MAGYSLGQRGGEAVERPVVICHSDGVGEGFSRIQRSDGRRRFHFRKGSNRFSWALSPAVTRSVPSGMGWRRGVTLPRENYACGKFSCPIARWSEAKNRPEESEEESTREYSSSRCTRALLGPKIPILWGPIKTAQKRKLRLALEALSGTAGELGHEVSRDETTGANRPDATLSVRRKTICICSLLKKNK